MEYSIMTESERIPKTVKFVQDRISELNHQLKECDYIEDVNGKPIYFPSAYADEKRRISGEIETLRIIERMLTNSVPMHVYDY